MSESASERTHNARYATTSRWWFAKKANRRMRLAFFVGRHSQALPGVLGDYVGLGSGLDDSEPLEPSAPRGGGFGVRFSSTPISKD